MIDEPKEINGIWVYGDYAYSSKEKANIAKKSMDKFRKEVICIGDDIRFLGKNGYDFELEKAKLYFNEALTYQVADIRIGNSHSVIKIVGFDSWWNSVMFERLRK